MTSFYVDNYLESFETEEETITQAKGLREILALGGFNLTKWMSTSRTILEQLREFGLANPTVDLNFDELPMEETLGVLWASNFEVQEHTDEEQIPRSHRESV